MLPHSNHYNEGSRCGVPQNFGTKSQVLSRGWIYRVFITLPASMATPPGCPRTEFLHGCLCFRSILASPELLVRLVEAPGHLL